MVGSGNAPGGRTPAVSPIAISPLAAPMAMPEWSIPCIWPWSIPPAAPAAAPDMSMPPWSIPSMPPIAPWSMPMSIMVSEGRSRISGTAAVMPGRGASVPRA